MLSFRLSGLFLLRLATRTLRGLLFQEPPRSDREPLGPPPADILPFRSVRRAAPAPAADLAADRVHEACSVLEAPQRDHLKLVGQTPQVAGDVPIVPKLCLGMPAGKLCFPTPTNR